MNERKISVSNLLKYADAEFAYVYDTEVCKKCIHDEVCADSIKKDFWIKTKMNLPNHSCKFFIEKTNTVTFPAKIGETVWVSPNNGKFFHTGKLYGINESQSYLVFVDDAVTDLVSFPLKGECFYDWFFKVYTYEEARIIFESKSL